MSDEELCCNSCGSVAGVSRLRARVAELTSERAAAYLAHDHNVAWKALWERCEGAEARVADLVALLIDVVHCGGQCPPELIAKIERATQEEAGWTDSAAPRGT